MHGSILKIAETNHQNTAKYERKLMARKCQVENLRKIVLSKNEAIRSLTDNMFNDRGWDSGENDDEPEGETAAEVESTVAADTRSTDEEVEPATSTDRPRTEEVD